MNREQLMTVLALMVSGVWAIVALASLLIGDYTGLAAVTPVMMVVAGFLFGYRTATTNGEEDDQPARPPG